MHPYTIDSEERRNVLVGIIGVSIGLAYGVHWLMERINIQTPWWMEHPSILGIIGILYKAFDSWLWCWFGKIGIVKVPNLQGEWEVEGYTSFEQTRSFKAKAIIRQTWTRISVYLETERSISRSLAACLLPSQPEGAVLIYQYRNEPKPEAAETMHAHIGTTLLRVKNAKRMEGEYYSGRDRQTYGSLILKRIGNAC